MSMEEKKLRDLTVDDLGRYAVYTAKDGDRQSGLLERISFNAGNNGTLSSVYFTIDKVNLSVRGADVDKAIQLGERPE